MVIAFAPSHLLTEVGVSEVHHEFMAKVINGTHEPLGAELEWLSDVEEEAVENSREIRASLQKEVEYTFHLGRSSR